MKCIILAALVGVLATSVSANVQATSIRLIGAGFKDACSRANHDWISFCNGYVQAIIDENRDICLPQGTTRTQIVEDVQSSLQSQPALKNLNAADHLIFVTVFIRGG